jgi:hypothetical protein
MDATATARGAKIVADMRTIDSAIMLYQAKTGSLATASNQLVVTGNQSASYLAAWPVPPQGQTASINDSKGVAHDWTVGTDDTYSINADGRAIIGSKTIDAILAGSGGSFK